MTKSARDQAISFLEFARWYSHGMLKGIPDDKYTFQPSKTDNHVSWVLGHLAGTEAWICDVVKAPNGDAPKDVREAYGMKSKPSVPAKHTPEQLRTLFEQTRAAFIAWLKTADDAALSQDLSAATQGFATDPIDAAHKIAWHEGFHFGQVANVRKALGIEPFM